MCNEEKEQKKDKNKRTRKLCYGINKSEENFLVLWNCFLTQHFIRDVRRMRVKSKDR